MLPEVLSTSVAPGPSRPASSARRTMFQAIRSLTDPAGVVDLELDEHRRHAGIGHPVQLDEGGVSNEIEDRLGEFHGGYSRVATVTGGREGGILPNAAPARAGAARLLPRAARRGRRGSSACRGSQSRCRWKQAPPARLLSASGRTPSRRDTVRTPGAAGTRLGHGRQRRIMSRWSGVSLLGHRCARVRASGTSNVLVSCRHEAPNCPMPALGLRRSA